MSDVRPYYLQTLKTAKIQQFQPLDVADTVAFIDSLDQHRPDYIATHFGELREYLWHDMPDAAVLLTSPDRLATAMAGWMRCAQTNQLTEHIKTTWGLTDEDTRLLLMALASFGTTPDQIEGYLSRKIPLNTVLQETQHPISRSPIDSAESYLSGFYESPLEKSPKDTDTPQSEFEEVALQANSNFRKALTATLALEGGYVNNPSDPGGETNFGITLATYDEYLQQKGLSKVAMRDISEEHVEDIYRTMFWDRVKGDQLPPKLAIQVFDFAVNSGPDRAIRYLQFLVGTTQDGKLGPKTLAAVHAQCSEQGEMGLARHYLDKRREFMARFASRHPEFESGLTNRLNTMERMLLC